MGHPDKVADHVSDAVLDAMLAQDPKSRVACETLVKSSMVIVAGEITTTAVVDIPSVVRQTIKKIGYDDPALGFDHENCAVLVSIGKQSPDISQGLVGYCSTPSYINAFIRTLPNTTQTHCPNRRGDFGLRQGRTRDLPETYSCNTLRTDRTEDAACDQERPPDACTL